MIVPVGGGFGLSEVLLGFVGAVGVIFFGTTVMSTSLFTGKPSGRAKNETWNVPRSLNANVEA